MAKLDFYNKEITKIQQELFEKLDKVIAGLSQLSDTEVLQLAKQIDFFDEMNNSSYLETYKKYYFKNDPHFNKIGHKVLANKLIEIFK